MARKPRPTRVHNIAVWTGAGSLVVALIALGVQLQSVAEQRAGNAETVRHNLHDETRDILVALDGRIDQIGAWIAEYQASNDPRASEYAQNFSIAQTYRNWANENWTAGNYDAAQSAIVVSNHYLGKIPDPTRPPTVYLFWFLITTGITIVIVFASAWTRQRRGS